MGLSESMEDPVPVLLDGTAAPKGTGWKSLLQSLLAVPTPSATIPAAPGKGQAVGAFEAEAAVRGWGKGRQPEAWPAGDATGFCVSMCARVCVPMCMHVSVGTVGGSPYLAP